MKILLSLPDTLAEKVDKYCAEWDYERSEFIRMLIRKRLEEGETQELDMQPFVQKREFVTREEIMNPVTRIVSSPQPYPVETFVGNSYEIETITSNEWCQGHFEKGKVYKCYKVDYSDENGNPVITDKWLCERCLRGYMNKGIGKVYGHLE